MNAPTRHTDARTDMAISAVLVGVCIAVLSHVLQRHDGMAHALAFLSAGCGLLTIDLMLLADAYARWKFERWDAEDAEEEA